MTAIQTFVLAGPTQGISAIVRIVFFTAALCFVQWQLALITLAAAPVLVCVTRHFARLRQQAAREQRRRSGAVAAVAEDALHNLGLVQCSGREEYEARRLDEHGAGAMRARLTSAKIGGIYGLLVELVELAGGVLVIGVGVWTLSHDRITLGGLLVFLAYLAELYSPVRGLGRLTTTLFTAAAAAHVGYMDTDMVADVAAPKSSPADIARIAVDGLEADLAEILAGDVSRRVQAGLAGGVAALCPDLARA